MDRWLIEGIGWRWIASTLTVACCLAAPAAAAGSGKADLTVTKVRGVPVHALTGDKLSLKVTVANKGNARSKPATVSSRLAPEAGSPLPDLIGKAKVGRLAPKHATTEKLKAAIPLSAVGRWKLAVCVAPGKQSNDCRLSSSVEVKDGSSQALIESARGAGALDPGEADLYELYSLTGDSRLPRAYRGNGNFSADSPFGQIAEDWASLSDAERAALWPYLLQPRYAQSAWAPAGAKAPHSKVGDALKATDPCAGLDTLSGAWGGVESAHARFWYPSGSASGLAKAQALAGEFEQRIWPDLTAAFKTVDDAAATPCDPAGDSKIDVYLATSPLERGGEGVAPVVPVGADCGPYPAFVVMKQNASRWTLAHEFFHVIQWAYRACSRSPAWVEGTATWAGDFVYKDDQDEHNYVKQLSFPYESLLDHDYDTWPFWYSLAKHGGGAPVIKQFLESLATQNTQQALGSVSGGLTAAWKRYAQESWNQAPIGSSGFPVGESFRQWDGFSAKPAFVPETHAVLGGQDERTFKLETYGPGGIGDPSKDLPPLSTSFNKVTVDNDVRELRFKNALNGIPGTVVQAFLKLKDGTWHLQDWSDKSAVTLCRDKSDENVTELIVATSNASATGGPLGRTKHDLRVRPHCEQAPIQGSFTGTAVYTDVSETINWSWSGTATFEADGQINPWFPMYSSEAWDRYALTGGSVTLSGSGSTGDCTIDIPSASYSFAGQYASGEVVVQPGDQPHYGIELYFPGDQFPEYHFQCPDQEPSSAQGPGPVALIYTKDPQQATTRGTYNGSAAYTIPGTGYSTNFSWSFAGG